MKLAASMTLATALSATPSFASEPVSLSDWTERSAATRELQPHWESLLGMASPRLTQGFRYNYARQSLPGGGTVANHGGGKGLELILGENFEVQIGLPARIEKNTPKAAYSGWSDETLLGKYRILSANEENGNYVASFSLGMSLPTGSAPFSSRSTVFVPTLAGGKGWGTRERGFDIQSSLSASLPNRMGSAGMPVTWTIALQGHVLQHVWPEAEASYTHWFRGSNDGKSQLVLTYGVVFGRFEIAKTEKLTLGIGYQEPRGGGYAAFDRGWLAMMKLSF